MILVPQKERHEIGRLWWEDLVHALSAEDTPESIRHELDVIGFSELSEPLLSCQLLLPPSSARHLSGVWDHSGTEALAEGVECNASHVDRRIFEQTFERTDRLIRAHVAKLACDGDAPIAIGIEPVEQSILDKIGKGEVKALDRCLPHQPLPPAYQSNEWIRG